MKKLALSFLLLLLLAACATSTPTSQTVGLGTPPPTLQPGMILRTAQPSVWGKFGLSGRLVLIEFNADGNQLESLNLATGAMTLLYQAPQRSLLIGAAVSPDGKQIVLVYAPPPGADGTFTLSNLYLMPADGSSLPKLLISSATANDAFYNPSWSPDGKAIYSSHFRQGDSQTGTADQYTVDKISMDGTFTTIIQNAIWPVISPDATKIAYLSASSSTTTNNLYVAAIDGSNPTPVVPASAFTSVDAHLFTPDGQNLIFSAVNPTASLPPETTWLDRLFGITVASAHNVPSDWYEQALSGGNPVRLTQVADTGMNASLSPDGKAMAFIGSQGLYAYDLTAKKTQTLSTIEVVGTIDWLP